MVAGLGPGVGQFLSDGWVSFRAMRPHWRHIKTNNPLERILREVRRRTRVVGAFPDGQSALMLVGARLRHIAGTKWGTKKYVDIGLLDKSSRPAAVTGSAPFGGIRIGRKSRAAPR